MIELFFFHIVITFKVGNKTKLNGAKNCESLIRVKGCSRVTTKGAFLKGNIKLMKSSTKVPTWFGYLFHLKASYERNEDSSLFPNFLYVTCKPLTPG